MVIERGYGDCKDKALLLINLAAAVGIQARYALLRTVSAGRIQRNVPNQQFNHVIVYLPVQAGFERASFIDPTATDLDMGALSPDDQGATSLVLDIATGAYEFLDIPMSLPADNRETHRIRIELTSTTQGHAVDDMTVSGSGGMMLRRGLHNRERARKAIESEAAAMFSGALLTNLRAENDDDIWHPVGLHLELDVSNAIQAQDDRFRIKPPPMFQLGPAASLGQRQTPLWFGAPGAASFEMETILPEGYQSVRLPANLAIKHSCFSVTRSSHAEGRRVVVKLDAERTCASVEVADYAGFRAAVQGALRQLDDEIVFAKAAPPAAAPRKGKSALSAAK
jgi:hypothetical protein